MRPVSLLAALSICVSAAPALADPQSRAQQACIEAVHKGYGSVADARLAALARCAKAVAKGNAPAECTGTSSKVEKARLKAASHAAKKCSVPPDFGAGEAEDASAAAEAAAKALFEDAFGTGFDAFADRDKQTRSCQESAVKALAKCQKAHQSEFLKCAKAGLKTGSIADGNALAPCLDADPKGKVAKACANAAAKLAEKCEKKDADLVGGVPGCNLIGAGRSLDGCFARASDCRTCEGQSDAGALEPACAACAPDALLVAPGGAGAPANISIANLGRAGFPDADELTSSVFEIGPDGTSFEEPVMLALPIDPNTPDGTPIRVVRLNESSSEWETVPGTFVVGDYAFARTDHLSEYSTAPTLTGPGCYDSWYAGAAGAVPPMHQPGALQVAGATGLRQDIVYSGTNPLALGSEWSITQCSALVTGQFGPLVSGSGAWQDYSHPLVTPIPGNSAGQFQFTLVNSLPAAPRGPFFGIADPCYAAVDVFNYQLALHFAADCTDRCLHVTCDDGDPCTDEVCDPGSGQCIASPRTACGSSNTGMCIQGVCTLRVPLDGTTTGQQSCAAQGLACVEPLPVFTPASAACLAFHPGASVTQSTSGWRQAVYCDNDQGLACAPNPANPKLDTCHDCPACIATGITCGDGTSSLASELFVRCD